MADNDWYNFTIPSNKNYSRASFVLDSASLSAGYKLELYTQTSSGGMKKEAMSGNKVSLSSGVRYYVRVTPLGASSIVFSNYTLTITPEFVADTVYLTEFAGGGWATYYGQTYYKVNGSLGA